MATVAVQILGGTRQFVEGVQTVQELKTKLGVPTHAASINGDPASDSDRLDDNSFVTLSPAVKGGAI